MPANEPESMEQNILFCAAIKPHKLRGSETTKGGLATPFITPDGKVLKKVVHSIDKRIEEQVFTKCADYLV